MKGKEWTLLKKNQSNENIILKQKIIHFQSELSRYKEKLKRYENHPNSTDYGQIDQEKQQLEIQVAELSRDVTVLKKQVEELKVENNILKGNSSNEGEIKNHQTVRKQTLDSWFVNNLENQNAIRRSGRPDTNK